MVEAASVIEAEVQRFDALAGVWWDPKGPMAPLHAINPVRMRFVRDAIVKHFARDANAPSPLTGLSALDIGCGAGLLSEPLSRLGADTLGLDPAGDAIGAARRHAEDSGASARYRAGAVEDLAREGAEFDVVLAMEVVEHVADVGAFLAEAAKVLKPGGLFIGSTLNRTFKSFALAIVGAEYVLRWLPVGTHRWDKFVAPKEFADALKTAGLTAPAATGLVYAPLAREWRLARELDVNYFIVAAKPAA
jgi:2-polyprenyl-6-hydroxyphenyl methylase/3-demethylubiquinone-9 3-methyltransferase